VFNIEIIKKIPTGHKWPFSDTLIICHLFLLCSLPPRVNAIDKCGSLAGQFCLNSFLSAHSRIILAIDIHFALVLQFICNRPSSIYLMAFHLYLSLFAI